MSTPADSLVRVEKGHADPEELAAITAILLARAAAGGRRRRRTAVTAPRPAGAAWSAPRASAPRTPGRADLRSAVPGRTEGPRTTRRVLGVLATPDGLRGR